MEANKLHAECCSEDRNDGGHSSGNHAHTSNHGHDHSTINGHGNEDLGWKSHWYLLLSFIILTIMLVLQYGFGVVFEKIINFGAYSVAYLLAGWNVLYMAFKKARHLDIFNEFILMSVATLGAFAIGEYSEGVAVMVFYSIGEWFQDTAVDRAKRSIKALLDVRPEQVSVLRNGLVQLVHPSTVVLNETIQIRPGEKVALDGELASENASFNTAALSGESKPDTKYKGEPILAGMVNLTSVARIKVTALFKDSKLSKILGMVQDASSRKSATQLFISRFAKIYTPIVFFLALTVCFLPYFFIDHYNFYDWFYRSLVFLVISCPCALVVSIPLGYFGGIGLASRHGILFKGGNFLDVMAKINLVVMDKTGTLTKGVFKVRDIVSVDASKEEFIRLAAILENHSTHPVAKAIVDYAGPIPSNIDIGSIEEIAGHGIKGSVEGKEIVAGNQRLLKKFSIEYPPELDKIADTIVILSINNTYAGYLTIADEIKEDSARAIKQLHDLKIKTIMLSGDKQAVVDDVAQKLGIDSAFGGLLPEEKVLKVQTFKREGSRLAFVGDGMNDAPVVALADAGIAMGRLGSDVTIEIADIIIQNDKPSSIVSAIQIGKATRNIVWQNIISAMLVKGLILLLGAGGAATLWEAVLADVGVAFLAILNAVRLQRMRIL